MAALPGLAIQIQINHQCFRRDIFQIQTSSTIEVLAITLAYEIRKHNTTQMSPTEPILFNLRDEYSRYFQIENLSELSQLILLYF